MPAVGQPIPRFGSKKSAHSFAVYAVVAVIFFLCGYIGALLFKHAEAIGAVFHEASLARYEIMAGERGPVTYLVFHDDYTRLQMLASDSDEILGVEQSAGSNVAKIAFVSAQSPAINLVASQSFTGEMMRRNVPMICH